ncbi:MAG: hypothetical protein HQL42_11770 [Alphaproteobacteria bacterium]|nr:hypothetical protein [Alphaproteobacteria bacterium]
MTISRERFLVAVSVAVYIASLAAPTAICIGDQCDSWPGYGILLFGWLAVYASPANMTWLANPLLFICWMLQLFSSTKAALMAGLAALGLAASFLLYDQVLSSESGSLSTITGTAPGYWLWLAAMAVACANSIMALRKRPVP